MKKFVVKTILLSLPVLLVLIASNYYGDAARLFDNKYEAAMADVIKKGSNVTDVSSNFDDRIFRRTLASNLQFQPDILIIGSSRTLLMGSEHFEGARTFNSSVTGASIEDIVAMYQMYKSRGKLPRKIILGIDPWTFNEANDQKRWKSVAAEYQAFLKDHNKAFAKSEELSDNKYLELLSPSYFQSSFKNVPDVLLGKQMKPKATGNKHNKTNTWLTDGSLAYGESFHNMTAQEIDKKARKYVEGKVYSIENFDTLSPRIIDVFTALLKDIRSNKIDVEIFLAPYHPVVYKKVQQEYPSVLQAEQFVKQIAAAEKINVIGSFDPIALGMDQTYFYDGMHCKENGIRQLLADARK